MNLKYLKNDYFTQEMARHWKPSVERIVELAKPIEKRAAPILQPTENLDQDLVILSSGLRRLGLVTEAENLEDKIVLRKIAEKNLIDQAHPDRNVEIASSSNHHGIVHTVNTRHEEILKALNKKPTGKIAEILNHVTGILKQSQIPVANPFSKDVKGTQSQANIKLINDTLAVIPENIISPIDILIKNVGKDVRFSAESVLRGTPDFLNIYIINSGLPGDKVISFVTKYKTLGADFSAQWIYKQLDSKTPDAKKLVEAWDPSLIYLFGGNDKNKIETTSDKALNVVKEVGKFVVPFVGQISQNLDEKDIKNAAMRLYQTISSQYQEILGEDKLDLATKKLRSSLSAALFPLNQVKTELTGLQLEEGATSNENVLGQLQKSMSEVNSLGKNKSTKSILDALAIISGGDSSEIIGQINNIAVQINKFLNEIKSYPIAPNDKVINDGSNRASLDAIVNKFGNAGKMLENFLGTLAEGDPKIAKFAPIKERIQKIYGILYKNCYADSNPKTFEEVRKILASELPKADSFEKLMQYADKWEKDAGKVTGQKVANQNFKLTKISQFEDPAPASKPLAGKPSSVPSPTGAGGSSIKEMQTTLNMFLDKYKQPNQKIGIDGNWGKKTRDALNYINLNIIKTREDLRLIEDLKSPQDAIKNTNILNKILNYRATGEESDSGYDSLPSVSELTATTEPDFTSGGTIKLSGTDLRSLFSFYQFLTDNNLEIPAQMPDSDTAQGGEGFTLGQYYVILNWFLKRATFLRDASGSFKGLKENARGYFDAVQNLKNQLAGIKKRNEDILTENFLRKIVGGRGMSGGNPSNYNRNSSSGEDLDGQGYGGGISKNRAKQPPISDTIDLEQLGINDGDLNTRYLYLNNFYNGQGVDLANRLVNTDKMAPGEARTDLFFKNWLTTKLSPAISRSIRLWQQTAPPELAQNVDRSQSEWTQAIRQKLDQLNSFNPSKVGNPALVR